MLLALDEIGNLAPLPSLPVLMADGGGTFSSRDLQDLSTLLGEQDEITYSLTLGETGNRSHQRSLRRVPIMPPDVIRRLPYGTALVLLRSAPPIVARLRPWTARADARQLQRHRAEIEALLHAAHHAHPTDENDPADVTEGKEQ